jgi:hypothetical protein
LCPALYQEPSPVHGEEDVRDASFCPDTKAAGGAFWARGETVKFSSSFPIPDAKVSNDAEIAAVCRAIHEVAAHPELTLGHRDATNVG